MKKGLLYATCTLIVLVSIALGLKLVDLLIRSASRLPGNDLEYASKTIRTLDLYPYDGWHVAANFEHRGPMPWEPDPNTDVDFKTGDQGYLIDFSLASPPAKDAREFRILWVGGSGAQGWGASSNANTAASLLEQRLNERYAQKQIKFKVINLAMGSSHTYQNYVALNRLGHRLEPDLIVSYSGRNDVYVPIVHESNTDSIYMFAQLYSLALACRNSELPPLYEAVSKVYPNLVRSDIGLALRMLTSRKYYYDKARTELQQNINFGVKRSPIEYLRDVVYPSYADALGSIKRDFQGIPIMLAFQAMSESDLTRVSDLYKADPDYYDKMFEFTEKRLHGYVNDDWLFLNVHARFYGKGVDGIATHLTDNGQRLVADVIAEALIPKLDSGWLDRAMQTRRAKR